MSRHANLALVGQWLIMKPINHVLCGVLFDRTSDADHFRLLWLAHPVFDLHPTCSLTWSYDLYRPDRVAWTWSSPDLAEIVADMIERDALPQLDKLSSLRSFLHFALSHRQSAHRLTEYPNPRVIIDVALGDLEAARRLSSGPLSRWLAVAQPKDDYDRTKLHGLKALCDLLERDDRDGMASLLHAWEARKIKNLKLEHVWEKTPFPLETRPTR
ncbi:MAG: hypothetical protein ACKVP7_06205 [Hyphomicrobiaceae bacterium]